MMCSCPISSDLLEQVLTDLPEITLNFMEGRSPRLRKMLVTGVVDVAVLSRNVDPAHLILGASFTEPIPLVGAKGDPLLDGDEPLTLAEIVDLPLIIAGIRKEGIRDIVERA